MARNISYRRQIEGELEELQRRLMGLAAASASILGSPDTVTVASTAIDIARDVFAADAYALWRVDRGGAWRIIRAFGISDDFASRAIRSAGDGPNPPVVPFSEPLIAEDVQATAMLADMRDAYARERIESMIVFPLRIRGQRSGRSSSLACSRRSMRLTRMLLVASKWGSPPGACPQQR